MESNDVNSSTKSDWWNLGNVIKEILQTNDFDLSLSKSEVNILNILDKDNENANLVLNYEVIDRLIKDTINELPKYDKYNLNAYKLSLKSKHVFFSELV